MYLKEQGTRKCSRRVTNDARGWCSAKQRERFVSRFDSWNRILIGDLRKVRYTGELGQRFMSFDLVVEHNFRFKSRNHQLNQGEMVQGQLDEPPI